MDKLAWFTSSYSSFNGQCVECARTHEGGMVVRDSKDAVGVVLSFRKEAWREFLAGARRG
jgi:Domain of unknown function (DUF397)